MIFIWKRLQTLFYQFIELLSVYWTLCHAKKNRKKVISQSWTIVLQTNWGMDETKFALRSSSRSACPLYLAVNIPIFHCDWKYCQGLDLHLQLKNWDKVNRPSNFSLTSYYLPLFRTEQCSKILKKVQDLTSWLLCLSLLALSLTDVAILNGEHIVNFERFNGNLLLDGFIFTFCSFMLTIHNPLILYIWSSAKPCSSYSLTAFYAVANLFYSSICLHILWFRLKRLVVWGLTIRHFLCYHFTWVHVAQM